jgi:hypothetical protein
LPLETLNKKLKVEEGIIKTVFVRSYFSCPLEMDGWIHFYSTVQILSVAADLLYWGSYNLMLFVLCWAWFGTMYPMP